ncbi:AAA family ATPase [Colwellia demingiae]|uniref:AAA family ATPase n=1 Tax=Colwellia demingiae TaxID=89401 RepID=A0A5C6QS95_9GAMM|nr:AAA family ATPase [Colwellia demingiae]TWX71719.1 AAA family ATPase [Colwellia demingiae]
MPIFEGEIQVRKIRKRGGAGGIIFSSITLEPTPRRFVIKASYKVTRSPKLFKEFHIWKVKGEISQQVIEWKDGTKHTEQVIIPETLDFVKAAHENLKKLLSESPSFKGISEIKAEKLISFFGDELISIALNGNIERLLPIVGENVAKRLIIGLQEYEELATLQLLDKLGVPPRIGDSILKIWGIDAYQQITKNPYFLTAFEADLNLIDAFALDRLKRKPTDPDRLAAYAKSILFNAFKGGNTCINTSKWRYQLKRLLGNAEQTEKAIQHSIAQGEVVILNDMVQVKSMNIIESGIVDFTNQLINRTYPKPTQQKSQYYIKKYESIAGFPLTYEQKNAVKLCLAHGLTILTGGAGCGKTTVLEAICFTLENLKLTSQIILMALAGKAAQRITETTGRDAMTIAGFLHNVNVDNLPDDVVIIIDEASMVDVLSLYQVLRKLPKKGRLILTGDQEQLPPVGIGLTLHTLVNLSIPHSHLSENKRQSESSGIPLISTEMRLWSEQSSSIAFSNYKDKGIGVSFIDSNKTDLQTNVLKTYQELGGDGSDNEVLILSPVRHANGGTQNLNALIHDNFIRGKRLTFEHEEFGWVNHSLLGRAVRTGELVLYKRNDYQRDLRNGSIGKVIDKDEFSDGIIVNFSGNIVTLTSSDLNDLEHAYAMTVHKAQGSQFTRVIVVVREGRNLDRHLLYTAVTRAIEQVVFIGDKADFYNALSRSNSLKRLTLLKYLFKSKTD